MTTLKSYIKNEFNKEKKGYTIWKKKNKHSDQTELKNEHIYLF